MTESDLAILGGPPARTAPFTVAPMLDGEEARLVLDAVRGQNFSRYIGIPVGAEVLTMTSAEAAAITDDWHFLGGPNVRAFAADFARAFDVPYAVPVSSATVGLATALAAAGIGPGDEVILPAISFSATASAVLMFNSIPVFVDVDPETFCMDSDAVLAALTPRTRAIMPVHLAGNLADMDAIGDIAAPRGLKVIEDAAQAIGATWGGTKAGALGDAGVFSFQQSKNIMTGEGGMIITRDAEIAKRARLILNHGEIVFDDDSADADLANIVGFNFRMPELCAALGRAQLGKLAAVNAWRLRNAKVLKAELDGIPGLRLPAASAKAAPVPHMLVALYDGKEMGVPRDLFVAALRAEGVPVGTGYARPLYGAPLFLRRIAFGSQGCPWTCRDGQSEVRYRRGQCPVAERLLDEEFLWFYHIAHPSTEADMRDIGTALRKVVAGVGALRANAGMLRQRLGGHSAGRIGIAPAMTGPAANRPAANRPVAKGRPGAKGHPAAKGQS